MDETKNEIKGLLLLTALMVVLVGCNNPKIDQEAEAEKIMALSREWASSMPSDDFEKKLNYWVPNALILPPGQPAVREHAAIREFSMY